METNNIYEALAYIQQNLVAPKDKSVQIGGANGKIFKYRTAEGIFDAVKPLLKATNTTLTIDVDFKEVGGVNYCKAIATIAFKTKAGALEQVSTSAYAREGTTDFAEKTWIDKDKYKGEIHVKTQTSLDQIKGGQGSGAAISYATKYALCGLFLIDDGIDLDSTANVPKETPKETQKKTAEEYAKDVRDFIEKGNYDRATNGISFIKKSYPTYSTSDLETLLKSKENG